jgi:hypothetical protein
LSLQPTNPASHTTHITNCAYNTLLMGELVIPDWGEGCWAAAIVCRGCAGSLRLACPLGAATKRPFPSAHGRGMAYVAPHNGGAADSVCCGRGSSANPPQTCSTQSTSRACCMPPPAP